MWKKEEPPEPMAPRRPETALAIEQVPPRKASGERATIGRSIAINGEVRGDEDLLIQGRVDGSVALKQHAVTVGPEGEVNADIGARVITVEGTVEGNLSAQEQVILRGSARVQGNITAPRVVLEDGARFRGSVDMGETPAEVAPLEKGAPGAGWTAPGSAKVPGEPNASGATSKETSTSGAVKDAAAHAAASISR
jgi:cytoskeletal protein CcmA (bactofilin family)